MRQTSEPPAGPRVRVESGRTPAHSPQQHGAGATTVRDWLRLGGEALPVDGALRQRAARQRLRLGRLHLVLARRAQRACGKCLEALHCAWGLAAVEAESHRVLAPLLGGELLREDERHTVRHQRRISRLFRSQAMRRQQRQRREGPAADLLATQRVHAWWRVSNTGGCSQAGRNGARKQSPKVGIRQRIGEILFLICSRGSRGGYPLCVCVCVSFGRVGREVFI